MDELETAADLQCEATLDEVPTPRISILHLMLWTLCSSIYLTVIRAIYAAQGDMPSGYRTIQEASSLLQGIIAGATIAGTIVLVVTRFRYGPPMLRHPGHWFLFTSAILTLIYLPLLLALMLWSEVYAFGMSIFWVYGTVFLFPPVAYFFAARRSEDRRWKRLLFALAALSLIQSSSYLGMGFAASGFNSWFSISSSITTWGYSLVSAAVLAASLVDWVQGQRRDWLHWTGVATHVASTLVTFLWTIGSWFIG